MPGRGDRRPRRRCAPSLGTRRPDRPVRRPRRGLRGRGRPAAPDPVTGRLVTLEGIDGSGKSTQARLLAHALRARGEAVVETREPGGSPGAEAIRDLLLRGAPGRWSAVSEALLFTAARRDHVERVVEPALAEGRTVVCDRYVDSTRVYQGASGRGELRGLVDRLHAEAVGREADRTVIVDLDPAAALARTGGPETRFEAMGLAFQSRLRDGFLALAREFPERCRVVDGAGPPEAVAAQRAGGGGVSGPVSTSCGPSERLGRAVPRVRSVQAVAGRGAGRAPACAGVASAPSRAGAPPRTRMAWRELSANPATAARARWLRAHRRTTPRRLPEAWGRSAVGPSDGDGRTPASQRGVGPEALARPIGVRIGAARDAAGAREECPGIRGHDDAAVGRVGGVLDAAGRPRMLRPTGERRIGGCGRSLSLPRAGEALRRGARQREQLLGAAPAAVAVPGHGGAHAAPRPRSGAWASGRGRRARPSARSAKRAAERRTPRCEAGWPGRRGGRLAAAQERARRAEPIDGRKRSEARARDVGETDLPPARGGRGRGRRAFTTSGWIGTTDGRGGARRRGPRAARWRRAASRGRRARIGRCVGRRDPLRPGESGTSAREDGAALVDPTAWALAPRSEPPSGLDGPEPGGRADRSSTGAPAGGLTRVTPGSSPGRALSSLRSPRRPPRGGQAAPPGASRSGRRGGRSGGRTPRRSAAPRPLAQRSPAQRSHQ